MLYCDNCRSFFKKPQLKLYTDNDAFISKWIEVCPRCKDPDFLSAFICKRCGKLYIEKGRFCPECLKELNGIINDFLNKFTIDEQEAMLDGL